jgi:hypothetical protein
LSFGLQSLITSKTLEGLHYALSRTPDISPSCGPAK